MSALLLDVADLFPSWPIPSVRLVLYSARFIAHGHVTDKVTQACELEEMYSSAAKSSRISTGSASVLRNVRKPSLACSRSSRVGFARAAQCCREFNAHVEKGSWKDCVAGIRFADEGAVPLGLLAKAEKAAFQQDVMAHVTARSTRTKPCPFGTRCVCGTQATKTNQGPSTAKPPPLSSIYHLSPPNSHPSLPPPLVAASGSSTRT